MWLTRWASMLDVYVGSAAFCSPPRLLRHLEGSCCVQGATSHGGKLASRQWIRNKVTGPLDLRAVHCTARTSSVLLAGVPAQAPPPAPPFSTALLPALLAAAVSQGCGACCSRSIRSPPVAPPLAAAPSPSPTVSYGADRWLRGDACACRSHMSLQSD